MYVQLSECLYILPSSIIASTPSLWSKDTPLGGPYLKSRRRWAPLHYSVYIRSTCMCWHKPAYYCHILERADKLAGCIGCTDLWWFLHCVCSLAKAVRGAHKVMPLQCTGKQSGCVRQFGLALVVSLSERELLQYSLTCMALKCTHMSMLWAVPLTYIGKLSSRGSLQCGSDNSGDKHICPLYTIL